MGVWVVVEAFRSDEAWRVPRVALERGRDWKVREELMQETWSAFEVDEGCLFMENWGRGQVSVGLEITSGSQMRGAFSAKHSTLLCSHSLVYQLDRVLSYSVFTRRLWEGSWEYRSRKDIFPQI